MFLCAPSKKGIKSGKYCSCGYLAGTIQKWEKMRKFMEKAKCGSIKLVSCCIYFFFDLLLLLYGHIMCILQLTSNISSPLSRFFFHVLLKSNSHTRVGEVALPLPDYFKNVSLLLVLNVCQIAPHMC